MDIILPSHFIAFQYILNFVLFNVYWYLVISFIRWSKGLISQAYSNNNNCN